MKSWVQFFIQVQMDFKLWLCFMIFFLLFRIVFILTFRIQIEKTSTFSTITAAFLNGMRYDSVVATLWILIPFCFSVLSGFIDSGVWAQHARMIIGILFMSISSFLCFVTISYFREFGDQFNHFLLGIIYDDLKATILTIIKAYHFALNITGIMAITLLGWYLMKVSISDPFIPKALSEHLFSSLPSQFAVTLIIILLLIIAGRGTSGFGPPLRERHAAITKDKFLNKTVLNPYKALWYAINHHLRLSGSGGIKVFLPDKDVAKAAQFVSSNYEQYDDLDRYMLRYAKGPKGMPPLHIFYIVAESYSAWPLREKYASLHLADGLKGLAEEGIMIDPFISGSHGTMGTLNTIVTNLPDAGIMTNYRPTARSPYPTSIAKIFKDMQYRTRFFYGGFLSWQRVGDFCRDQGFEEIYGGGHMGDWSSSNEWGVDDEHLFDFTQRTIKDNLPSFNLILTTSFHPPFSVDVKAKGFTLNAIPPELKNISVDDVDFNVLGHLWYADKCIADFTRRITAALPNTLVVITADHAARRMINKDPDIFEKTSIPCIFYGSDVLKQISHPSIMAGNHLDLIPTLVELTASSGFAYHTIGKDLLDPLSHPIAVGQRIVIGPSFFLDLNMSPQLYSLPGTKALVTTDEIADLERLHDALHGIAWWRIMHGPKITQALKEGYEQNLLHSSH